MSFRERLADVARFMVRPSFLAQPMQWGREAATALLIVIALDCAVGLLADIALPLMDDAILGGLLPALVETDNTLIEDLFAFLVLAPVLEELLFRGWLSGRIAALRFGAYGMAGMGLMMSTLHLPDEFGRPLAKGVVAALFVALIQWSRSRQRDTDVPGWFSRHFHWLVWASTLLFGLIHLGSYEGFAHPLGLLVVLPQTIGGLLLAYTRTRLGLRAAIFHHAAYNGLYVAGNFAGS